MERENGENGRVVKERRGIHLFAIKKGTILKTRD